MIHIIIQVANMNIVRTDYTLHVIYSTNFAGLVFFDKFNFLYNRSRRVVNNIKIKRSTHTKQRHTTNTYACVCVCVRFTNLFSVIVVFVVSFYCVLFKYTESFFFVIFTFPPANRDHESLHILSLFSMLIHFELYPCFNF